MFRPCIDLHEGKVKQLVGGTVDTSALQTNFVSDRSSQWYAELFRKDGLKGGHVIMLGQGNQEPAREALAAYPGGLQIGGGIHSENAAEWLKAGASHVIVTSFLFENDRFSLDKLKKVHEKTGADKLVLDLSCRWKDGKYFVVTNRWQTFTDTVLSKEFILELEPYCDEFLIHAADIEGLCSGMDLRLLNLLTAYGTKPITYAGGAKSIEDLETVHTIGKGRIHLTIGSALDIFGGKGVRYEEAVAFNRRAG